MNRSPLWVLNWLVLVMQHVMNVLLWIVVSDSELNALLKTLWYLFAIGWFFGSLAVWEAIKNYNALQLRTHRRMKRLERKA